MTHVAGSRRWVGAAASVASFLGLLLFPSPVAASTPPRVSLVPPSDAYYGQKITLTAIVTGLSGTPTGRVQFRDSGADLVTAQLLGSSLFAKATAIVTMSVRMHSIDALYGAVQSTPRAAVSVVAAPTTLTMVSSRNSSAAGQQTILTATVSSSASPCPTGSVTFSDNGAPLGQGTLGDPGHPCQQAALATSSLSVGNHAIVGRYAGDGNFSPSASNAYGQQVTRESTPVTAANPGPGPTNGPAPRPGSAALPTSLAGPPSAATASPSAQAASGPAPPTPPADRPFGSAPNVPLPASILDTSAVPPIAVLSMVSGIRMGSAPQIILFLFTFNILVLGGIFIASRRGRDLTRRSLTGHS